MTRVFKRRWLGPHVKTRDRGCIARAARLFHRGVYVGQRAPAHCSATGKAILAFREGFAVPTAAPLIRFTSTTIDDPAALARELALVHKRGYAVNQEEWRRGVCAIAVPLRGRGRRRGGIAQPHHAD
ncbi:MAG: IclR family transcriptional regulator domain-containing protein [Stellaceae bacterium]